MHNQAAIHPSLQNQGHLLPQLADPSPALLAGLLERRMADEEGRSAWAPLPAGVTSDLRPSLPKVGHAALMLYANRSHVDSYPLIYTILALVHPN